MRGADPATFQRAPCRYSNTGPSDACFSEAIHKPCSFVGSPVTREVNSTQTSLMSRASSALLPQLRSLGWKIQARCFSSNVVQPTVTARAVAAANRVQRFIDLD